MLRKQFFYAFCVLMIWGGFVVGYFGGGGEYPSFIVRLSFVIRSFIVRSGLGSVRGWLGGAW